MQALLAVFLEDLRRRWIVFGLAVFLGLTAAVLPWFPSRLGLAPDDLRQAGALAFLGLFLGLVPLFLGADLFSPGQASGRVGFFLARPLRPWQLLGGRLASALVACFGGAFLIVIPSWLLGVSFSEVLLEEHLEVLTQMMTLTSDPLYFVLYLPAFGLGLGLGAKPLSPLVFLALPFVLLALGHALSVFVRLAGLWSLFDLVAAVWIGRMMLTRQFELLSIHSEISVWPVFGGVFVAACVLGTWLQLRRGGTERARLHRVFSLSVAVPLLLATFAAEIWIDRLEERGPQFLERVLYATASDSGDEAVVVGDLGTHLGGFFLDPRNGSWKHFPIVDSWHHPTFVGGDFFWTRCIASFDTPEDATCRLLSIHLVQDRNPEGLPDLRHLQPGLGLLLGDSADPRHFDIHPDGEQVALFRSGRLQVVSWPENEILRSVRPPEQLMWVRYDESGRLRTWSASTGTTRRPRELLVSELSAEGLQPVARNEGTFEDLPEPLKPPHARFEIGPRSWGFDRETDCLTIGDEPYCFGELSGPS